MSNEQASKSSAVPVHDLGGIRVRGPEKRGRLWYVTAVDPVLESTEEKRFDTQGKAQTFVEQLLGVEHADPLDQSDAGRLKPGTLAQAGEVHKLAKPAPAQLTGNHARRGADGVKGSAGAPFNLGAVRDVLVAYELDPFVEIAKVLRKQTRRMVRDADGKPIMDADGNPTYEESDTIDGVDRAKILVELAQYITPKLKAVEMKLEDNRQLTLEQLDTRLGALLGKMAKSPADMQALLDQLALSMQAKGSA